MWRANQANVARHGGYVFGPLKSAAGKRFLVMAKVIIPAVRLHLRSYAEPSDENLVFTSRSGHR